MAFRRSRQLIFALLWRFCQRHAPRLWERLFCRVLSTKLFPPQAPDPLLRVDFLDISLPSPIGVAPACSHQLEMVDPLMDLGAGFGEFGPYTLEGENPTTETFFLPQDRAIVTQSLGVQNPGLLTVMPTLIKRHYLPHIIGVNMTSTTSYSEESVRAGERTPYHQEFNTMVRKVAPYCDFLTLDFSLPETELSRIISDGSTVVPLLQSVAQAARESAPLHCPRIIVKLPLNLTQLEFPMVCRYLVEARVDAVTIGGPFSLSNDSIRLSQDVHAGMLSGAPQKSAVLDMIKRFYQLTDGQIPIIACGGVFSGQDVYDYLAAGASVVQVDALLRFKGPMVISRLNRELTQILRSRGISSVAAVTGSDFY